MKTHKLETYEQFELSILLIAQCHRITKIVNSNCPCVSLKQQKCVCNLLGLPRFWIFEIFIGRNKLKLISVHQPYHCTLALPLSTSFTTYHQVYHLPLSTICACNIQEVFYHSKPPVFSILLLPTNLINTSTICQLIKIAYKAFNRTKINKLKISNSDLFTSVFICISQCVYLNNLLNFSIINYANNT